MMICDGAKKIKHLKGNYTSSENWVRNSVLCE